MESAAENPQNLHGDVFGGGFGADLKITLVYSIFFVAISFLVWKSPEDSKIRDYARDLFGIGIITFTLIIISIQIKDISREALIGVIGTLSGLYFGSGFQKRKTGKDRS